MTEIPLMKLAKESPDIKGMAGLRMSNIPKKQHAALEPAWRVQIKGPSVEASVTIKELADLDLVESLLFHVRQSVDVPGEIQGPEALGCRD